MTIDDEKFDKLISSLSSMNDNLIKINQNMENVSSCLDKYSQLLHSIDSKLFFIRNEINSIVYVANETNDKLLTGETLLDMLSDICTDLSSIKWRME